MTLKEILEIFKSLIIKVALTMMDIILDVFFRKGIKKDDLGFGIVKFLFITTVQEFNSTQHFLEAGVKGLGSHVMVFFLSTTHVMEKTVAYSNGASRGGNKIKETVGDLVEGASLVRYIFIF